jgi:hypothetical protein
VGVDVDAHGRGHGSGFYSYCPSDGSLMVL